MGLRDKQINALKNMFNFNQVTKDDEINWKILIYDQIGYDIISPHFTIKELRDYGITLNLHLNSQRDPIPDAPAIYFVYPSLENIEKIGKDCSEQLYEKFYLNFISPLSRHNMDILAAICVKNMCPNIIAKIYDQYLNYITLEDYVVLLNHPLNNDKKLYSFYEFNSKRVEDALVEKKIDALVDKLFCVFTTIVQIPIIFYPSTTNAAKLIGEKLHKKIQDNLKDPKNNLFIASNTSMFSMHNGVDSAHGFDSRCCLIMVDRTFDLVTPLAHTWTYQALCQDLFKYDLNKIGLAEHGINKTYDLNYDKDKFWKDHKGSPFPSVAEAIQNELEHYKSREGEIRRLKQNMGAGELGSSTLSNGVGGESEALMDILSGNTNALTNVVNSLPQLLETKKYLDCHTNIATEILDRIKKRHLDQYFELEEKILAKASYLDPDLFAFISDPSKGTLKDKFRLFLLSYMCNYIPKHELSKFLSVFRQYGSDGGSADAEIIANIDNIVKFVDYIRNINQSDSLDSLSNMSNTSTAMSNAFTPTEGFAKKIAMFGKLMSQGSQFVMEGVANFVVKQHKLPLTKLVDKLTEKPSTLANTASNLNLQSLAGSAGAMIQNQFSGGDKQRDGYGITNAKSGNKSKLIESTYMCHDPKLLKQTAPTSIDLSKTNPNITPYNNVYVCVIGGGTMMEFQNLMDYAKLKMNKQIYYLSSELMSPDLFVDQISMLAQEYST